MASESIIRVLREGLMLVLMLSAAPMLASMLVGVVVSVLQAATQLQEQTLSYVPKLVAVFLTLAVAGPWMLQQMIRFTQALFASISSVH